MLSKYGVASADVESGLTDVEGDVGMQYVVFRGAALVSRYAVCACRADHRSYSQTRRINARRAAPTYPVTPISDVSMPDERRTVRAGRCRYMTWRRVESEHVLRAHYVDVRGTWSRVW